MLKKKLFSLGLAAVSFMPASAQEANRGASKINADSVYSLPPKQLYQFIQDAHKRDPLVEIDTIVIESDNDIYKIDEAEGFYEKNLHIIRLTHYCVSPSGNFKVFTLAEMNEIFATLNSEIGFRMAHESDHAAKFNTLNYAALSPEEIIKMEIHFELSGRIAEFLAHRDVLLQSKCLPTAFPKHCMFYTRNYMQKNMSDLLALPEFWLRDSGKSAKLQQSLLKHFGHYFAYLGWLFANKNIPQNPEPDEINAIVSSVLTRFDADFKLYLHSLINGLLENMLNGVIARSQVQTSAVPAKSKEELIKYFWTFDGVCFWDIMDAKTKKQAQESLKKYLAKPALQKHIASVANEYPQYVFHDRDGR